mmetsp:Transcript_20009/g.29243  ORF Transcript_20009/g.29243 Transcript_20009/m.29243 type:complete len:97 (-) Transcript_20009:393-683(-)
MDPFATSEKNQPVKIRYGDGAAARTALTIVEEFNTIVEKNGNLPAIHQKVITQVRTRSSFIRAFLLTGWWKLEHGSPFTDQRSPRISIMVGDGCLY